MVIANIKHSYHPNKDETLLNANLQARLSCIVMAAIGKSYDHQYIAK